MEEGDMVMQMQIHPQTLQGIHPVQGELVLKNGLHLTDDDVRFEIEGMYLSDIGHLTGVLHPRRQIRIKISKEEIESNSRYYREALRKEASRWTEHPPPLVRFGIPPEKQLGLKQDCQFLIDLKVVRNNTSQHELDFSDTSSLHLAGSLTSQNCNVKLSLEADSFHLEKYYSKAVHYTLAVAVLTFLQILLLIKQIEVTSTPATSMRVSMLCISQQTIMDAYLCLLHLTIGIVIEPLFNAFAMVSFFEFVLFAVFEMRYMLLIWRASRGQSDDNWNTRRELSILYMRFYAVLLVGMLLAFRLQRYAKGLVFVLFSFWVPQSMHCIRSDLRQPLKPFFVIGMSIVRLLLPLYIYGCPSNILGVKPSPLLCVGLVSYVMVQVCILLVQYYYGPHCFLPKRFLPHKHDYFRHLEEGEMSEVMKRNGDVETGEPGMTECVICMNPVDIQRPTARMVTPCNHFFHPACLQRWMDVKMECPTCRSALPPL